MPSSYCSFSYEGAYCVLQSQLYLRATLAEVFSFFSDAHNLERITPSFLRFSICSPATLLMAKGLRINYRLRLAGIPFKWQSEITEWQPPQRFIDEQRHGPYLEWIHEHTFKERDDGVVAATDNVRYRVPGGRFVHEIFVKEQLRRIFEFRREALLKVFASPDILAEEQISAAIDSHASAEARMLRQLSTERPLFVVFLRHSGCTFCRETLAKLKQLRSQIEAAGMRIVLVHMSSEEDAANFFAFYQLSDVLRVADPECLLYRAFGLQRGTLSQLLGMRSWLRALFHGALFRHGIGVVREDSFQMPGSFVLDKGRVVYQHVPQSAADEAAFEVNKVCALSPR